MKFFIVDSFTVRMVIIKWGVPEVLEKCADCSVICWGPLVKFMLINIGSIYNNNNGLFCLCHKVPTQPISETAKSKWPPSGQSYNVIKQHVSFICYATVTFIQFKTKCEWTFTHNTAVSLQTYLLLSITNNYSNC